MDRRLARDVDRAMIAGVAAGWADYLDADPTLVRLVLVLLFLFGGIGLVFYLVCWVVMPPGRSGVNRAVPEQGPAAGRPPGPEPPSPPSSGAAGISRRAGGPSGRGGTVGGAILIVLGLLLLADQAPWLGWPSWIRLRTLWPSVLIVLGLYLVIVAARTSRRASG